MAGRRGSSPWAGKSVSPRSWRGMGTGGKHGHQNLCGNGIGPLGGGEVDGRPCRERGEL